MPAPPPPAAARTPPAARDRVGRGEPAGRGVDWDAVEGLLDEAAALARSDLPAAAFADAVLDRIVRGTGAAGAAVHEPGDGGGMSPAAARGACAELDGEPFAADDPAGHAALVARAAARPAGLIPAGAGVDPRGEPRDADGEADGPAEPCNPTDFLLALAPVGGGAVLEVAFPADLPAPARRPALEAVRSFAEVYEEGRTRREAGRLRGELAKARAADRFAAAVHAAGAVNEVCRVIVNAGVEAAAGEADRLAVAVPGWAGRGVRVAGVSGASVLDRRAGSVRTLERLAAEALRAHRKTKRDTFHADPAAGGGPGSNANPAPRVAARLAGAFGRHAEESGAADTAALVLADPVTGRPAGVLIADRFPDSPAAGDEVGFPPDPLASVRPHAAAALARARATRKGPARRLLAALAAPLGRTGVPWALPAAGLLAAAVAALVLVPAPFFVTARGRLVPAVSRDVFAPGDGVVRELRVAQDDAVETGETLARLVDPDLELRAEEVAGELDAVAARLASVRADRVAGPGGANRGGSGRAGGRGRGRRGSAGGGGAGTGRAAGLAGGPPAAAGRAARRPHRRQPGRRAGADRRPAGPAARPAGRPGGPADDRRRPRRPVAAGTVRPRPRRRPAARTPGRRGTAGGFLPAGDRPRADVRRDRRPRRPDRRAARRRGDGRGRRRGGRTERAGDLRTARRGGPGPAAGGHGRGPDRVRGAGGRVRLAPRSDRRGPHAGVVVKKSQPDASARDAARAARVSPARMTVTRAACGGVPR